MKLPISNRLLACCQFIFPGDRVADVGCDHGYLGIHLLRQGLASHVYASDINEGPLKSALRNALRFDVAQRMNFFLCPGVSQLPRDFDTLVCAGMGADTIISILEAAPWLKDARCRLILQCQSKVPQLRRWLCSQGYAIIRETLAQDGKFLYPVMEVSYAPGSNLTDAQCYLSPALLESGSALLPAFLEQTIQRLSKTAEGLRSAGDPRCDGYTAILEQLRQLEP